MALPFATPASLSPTFVISRCEVADVDALGSVYYDSFKGDRGNSHWWSPNREHMMEWMRSRILKKLADRSVRHFKIIDTEANELVAWARWDIPKDSTHFGDWNGVEAGVADVSSIVKEATEPVAVSSLGQEVSASALATSVDMQPVDIPKGANPEVARNFFNQLAVSATKWHKDDMLGLSLLCTAPKYHRRGAAKALLVPMLELADAHGVTTILEATPGGKPVYEKLGFQEVDTIDYDLGSLTKDQQGLYQLTMMIRAPKST